MFRNPDPLTARPRRAWKNAAIADIAQRVKDTNGIIAEVQGLAENMNRDTNRSSAWHSDRLMLFRNGEWLSYANKCSKEDRRIRDIFIARGSNGKWYFSTYHFCVRMISLQIEHQPESIAEFAERFAGQEFNGRSDVCLSRTWPPKRN